MVFHVQGELAGILAPLVSQILDSTYASREIDITFNAIFNDVNTINVINGIVKNGEYSRGVKISKEVSASQNYGVDLGILRRGNDYKLDLHNCRWTREMMEWIEEKLGDGSTSMQAATIYKNFMGIGGPNGIHYGLSKRLVQMYLLCLVRDGRLRIALSGRNLPVEAVDYSNIANVEFKVAVLDAFDQVQRLKPPEGWEVLAPFAAVLLQDDTVKSVREDADIQRSVQRLLDAKKEALEAFKKFHHGLLDLFNEWERPFGAAERLLAWEKYLSAQVDPSDPIAYLRSALEKAFGYSIYHEDSVKAEDVDDLATRRTEVEQAQRFYAHKENLRAAMRYLRVEIPTELDDLKRTFQTLNGRLKDLETWVFNESRLENDFLNPVESAIETYKVRYLQAFDSVVTYTEQARQQILELDARADFGALAALGQVRSLGSDSSAGLRQKTGELAASKLFPAKVTRAVLERDLLYLPQPVDCPLTLGNSADWPRHADEATKACAAFINEALLEKARLLNSPTLRERLEQGRSEPLVASLLGAKSPDELAHQVMDLSKAGQSAELARLLNLYLKKIRVQRVNLGDFKPAKHTLESSDLESVTQEFKAFLLARLQNQGDDDLSVVEIDQN